MYLTYVDTLALTVRRNYKVHWRDKDDFYWLNRLEEEVAELSEALYTKEHEHYPEHKLLHIASICLNWMDKRISNGVSPTPKQLEESLERYLSPPKTNDEPKTMCPNCLTWLKKYINLTGSAPRAKWSCRCGKSQETYNGYLKTNMTEQDYIDAGFIIDK